MAQLKNTVVSGNLRVTDTVLTDTVQTESIKAHSSSSATTFTTGTNGQVLTTDGTNVYWGDVATSDVNVTQTATITNSDYEVLFSGTADNTTRTEGARKNTNLKFNPSTGNLQATQLNGVAIGASPKFTDTDTKVTAVGNHYTPSADANSAIAASVNGTEGSYAINTEYSVVTGVNIQRDAKGHVTGATVTKQKIKDTNTTYESKAAASGGTDLSLVTTGEKYTWNNKTSNTGTVTSVTINATSPIAIDSNSAITTSGSRTISHANSGVTAGTYKSVTVNATGHVTGGTNPTTLAGYGITDAALASNTVTSIGTSGNYLTWTKNGNTNNITIPFATSSTTAAKLGTDTIGNIHRPIYIKNGIGTEVTDVAMDYIGWPKENHTNLSSLDNLYYFSAPNVLSYPKPDYIDIEYTNDGGTSWITHPSATNANKIALFTTSYGFSLGNKTSSAGITVNDGLRITLHLGAGMYCSMKFLAIRHFFPGECDVTIEYTTYANPTTYVEHTTLTKISSNPGYRIIPFDKFLFGNNGVHDLRITAFYTGTTYINNSYTISEIRGFANNVYTYTSQLANTGHLYSYDSDKNATFPANITAAKFVKSGGTSSQFLKADGSVDSNTYSTTDTKVTQTKTGSSNTSWRPLLLGYSYSDSNPFNPATVTNTTYAAHLGAFAPSTGLLKLVGLKRINTSGSDVTGSNTDVWNTNGSITSLSSYYQKPSGGIPASDLASGVIPSAPGTLNTTAITAQATSASEALTGSITLHKVAKTGTYSDLIGAPALDTFVTAEEQGSDFPIIGDPSNYYTKAETDAIAELAKVTEDPESGFAPNVYYAIGSVAGNKTFTLDTSQEKTGIANIYYWTFTTSTPAPTITWPSQITKWYGSIPTIRALKHYEISILDGIAVCIEI